MQLVDFLASIGHEVEEAEEDIPSQNLGFIDSQSHTIEISVHDRDLTIHQSPTVLSSKRAGGTTGAVLWKITPLFAQWLASDGNILWESSTLNQTSTVIELGCGVAGVLALTLGPSVGQYIATDQEYVRKLFQENLDENYQAVSRRNIRKQQSADRQRHQHHSNSHKSRTKPSNPRSAPHSPTNESQSRSPSRHPPYLKSHKTTSATSREIDKKIIFTPLDWETDTLSSLASSTVSNGFDLLLACDCIYNDALIAPFVQTCADIARLRPSLSASTTATRVSQGTEESSPVSKPTICIIAQQLRSHEVFES
ncbi:Ribosomal protein lysine methyltransferase [Emydomyces testavorans]|uniref:Ribosomal protein lysine methyltransferase n=1 Tax=Emydomyces testavorans TaxID=2070801 RepID=A0AAF0DI54_9EURO|nr:Ribosomal protein lysine methyltransferase [Emydomyces testavorans]